MLIVAIQSIIKILQRILFFSLKPCYTKSYMDYHWTFGQFIAGILAAGVGFLIVWKADWMYRNFGMIPFAEKYLATEGGTRIFYKLLGILIMIGGMMHATGLLAPTLGYFASKIFSNYALRKEN